MFGNWPNEEISIAANGWPVRRKNMSKKDEAAEKLGLELVDLVQDRWEWAFDFDGDNSDGINVADWLPEAADSENARLDEEEEVWEAAFERFLLEMIPPHQRIKLAGMWIEEHNAHEDTNPQLYGEGQ